MNETANDQPRVARIISRLPLYSGFLRVYRYCIEVQRRCGSLQCYEWELMERGDSVGVLAYDADRDEIVLGNECRPGALVAGVSPYRDQLIAGALDPGESPLDAAIREMREESGLELHDPQLIHGGAFVSSGGTTERISLVFGTVSATGATGAVHSADASEEVVCVVLPASVFINRVYSGAIDDLKTLVAGYWFALRWRELRDAKASGLEKAHEASDTGQIG